MGRANGVFWVLAVVGILLTASAFLLSTLLPRAMFCGRNANEAHANNQAYQLKHSLSAFSTEYRHFPLEDGTTDRIVDSGHALMDILLGSDPAGKTGGPNPRRIVFFSGRKAIPMGKGRYRKGLSYDDEDGTGQLWDPWGNLYRVRLDTDGNDRTESPEKVGSFLPEAVLVWSAGPDGDFETWEDNIRTW